MSVLSSLYTQILWRPLFNGLVFFYNELPWHDLGLAIIALTLVIRIALIPLLLKAQKAQKDLARIQPEIKRIQKEFKNEKEKQGKMLMELYAHHKVNPFSGCLLILIQLPILIALLQVFRTGLDPSQLHYLYSFVTHPGTLNPLSLGFLNLAKGNFYLGILAAITQYYQTTLAAPPPPEPGADKHDFNRILQLQTTYVLPLLILVWSWRLPAALTLYWTVLNVLGIVQEIIVKRMVNRKISNS